MRARADARCCCARGTAAALASLHSSGGAHVLASPAQRASIPEQGEHAPGSRAVLPAGAPAHPHHVTNLTAQALPPAAAPGSAARAGPSGAVQETLGYPNPTAPAGLALAPGAARGAAVEAGEAPFLPSSPGAFTPAALTPSFWWGTATAAYQARPARMQGSWDVSPAVPGSLCCSLSGPVASCIHTEVVCMLGIRSRCWYVLRLWRNPAVACAQA